MSLSTQEVGLTYGPFYIIGGSQYKWKQGNPPSLMEHKIKVVEMLKRYKIHLKAKVRMNIPLYCMISMPVVRPTLKINVFKMEHAFQMGYQKCNKVFYIFFTN
jgi:hypothetical protein